MFQQKFENYCKRKSHSLQFKFRLNDTFPNEYIYLKLRSIWLSKLQLNKHLAILAKDIWMKRSHKHIQAAMHIF